MWGWKTQRGSRYRLEETCGRKGGRYNCTSSCIVAIAVVIAAWLRWGRCARNWFAQRKSDPSRYRSSISMHWCDKRWGLLSVKEITCSSSAWNGLPPGNRRRLPPEKRMLVRRENEYIGRNNYLLCLSIDLWCDTAEPGSCRNYSVRCSMRLVNQSKERRNQIFW